jgi:NAD(P)-dependent dehydrogenase (short-subunit alcohol dehydrogenase family)
MTAVARFEGKNVVVTGGSRGIGRAIVEAFLAEGARVLAVDIRADGLDRLAAATESPDRLATHVADMADVDQARGMVREAVERLGRVDVLVNNAGVQPDGTALEVTTERGTRRSR